MSECGYMTKSGKPCKNERSYNKYTGYKAGCKRHLLMIMRDREEKRKQAQRDRLKKYHDARRATNQADKDRIIDMLISEILAQEPEIDSIEKLHKLFGGM